VDFNPDLNRSRVSCLSTRNLQSMLPQIEELLQPFQLPEDLKAHRDQGVSLMPLPKPISRAPSPLNFWNFSNDGELLSSLGCSPLSRGISTLQYDAVLESQQHLKTLKMLHLLDDVEVLKLTVKLQALLDITKYRDLLDSLLQGLTFNEIRVYRGLDSGFTVPGDSAHLWGVSASSTSGRMDIFISQKASSLASTVLHVYLAHHGISREHRYEEELLLEHALKPKAMIKLPMSIHAELADATNSELLVLLERLKVSKIDHSFSTILQETCVSRLLDESSREAWTECHSKCFLEGSLSMRDLLELRLTELARRGARVLPLLDNLEQLSQSVDLLITNALFSADRDKLNTLSKTLIDVYGPENGPPSKERIDVNADLFALIFFCVLRKAAFENVFLETTDRCPFFLTQPDQAGVFSELWVLGSQCDIYFGMFPRALGKIIYDQYRDYLTHNPPPSDSFNGVEVLTMYSFNHNIKEELPTPQRQQSSGFEFHLKDKIAKVAEKCMEFGALSIFCMPAIADVCLLTWYGRGFFQSVFMDPEVGHMANFAVVASLLVSSSGTGWVGSVGGHYLYNFAFDNMNFFLVQRLSGGLVLSLLVSMIGLVAFSLEYSPRIAAIFVAYVLALCTYLNLLGEQPLLRLKPNMFSKVHLRYSMSPSIHATDLIGSIANAGTGVLATMHRKRAPLTSGRTVLWRTIPLLFISPIASTFAPGHDLAIYLSVLYAFIFVLLYQYRQLCHEWSVATWTSKVPVLSTDEVTAWYQTTQLKGSEETKSELNGESLDKAAAAAFQAAVEAFTRKNRGRISDDEDTLVAEAAIGLPFALWLLEKESPSPSKKTTTKHDTEMFSKVWLAKVAQAMKNAQQLARGLKEHSVFVLYRYSKYDVGVLSPSSFIKTIR
jgi:hypothetical protein